MAITTRKKNQLANKDQLPKSIFLEILETRKEAYQSLLNVARELKEVKEHNIKLALRYKELNDKYRQLKKENFNINKTISDYYKAERDLNISLRCPLLNDKEIKLTDCIQSINYNYCKYYECIEKRDRISQHFRIKI